MRFVIDNFGEKLVTLAQKCCEFTKIIYTFVFVLLFIEPRHE